MKTTNEKKPIWYLALPVYQYNEDVNALAKAAGLRIIDANVTEDRTGAAPDDMLPQVTLRAEFIKDEPQATEQEAGTEEADGEDANTETDTTADVEAKPAPQPRKKKGD